MISLVNKVYEMLKACSVPLSYNSRPTLDNGMCLSYHFFNESSEFDEEGEESITGGTLQIDLFAKQGVDFTEAKKQIKALLKTNKFRHPTFSDSSEFVEGLGEITHVVITCNYLESEVLHG